jgi:hypothetical protein
LTKVIAAGAPHSLTELLTHQSSNVVLSALWALADISAEQEPHYIQVRAIIITRIIIIISITITITIIITITTTTTIITCTISFPTLLVTGPAC